MKSSLLVLALVISTSLCVSAQDVVRLKTGASMEGVIIEQDERSVTLEFPGGTMQLQRDQIAEITQSSNSEDVARRRALITLSRFAEQESFHFLYRDGHRCGYRTVALKREDREGLPGYAIHDRLVFLPTAGGVPDVDMKVTEFVDAELRPVHFECNITSGPSSRFVEGSRQGRTLSIKETSAGRREERTALLRDEVQFPRMLLRKLASEPPPEGSYPNFRVFRPHDVTFGDLGLARRLERLHLRGRERDVLVFERRTGQGALETWVDMAGQVVREEIGSTRLVSLVAPREEVLAWARGDDVPDGADLGLEFVSEPTGLRFLRPDLSWDLQPGQGANQCSLFRAGLRATVDVLRVPDLMADATPEGVALEVVQRIKRVAEDVKLESPYPDDVGAHKGLKFMLRGRRNGTTVKTLGAVIVEEGQAFVFLCAAPESQFVAAMPGFTEVLASVRILPRPEDPNDNPWATEEGGQGR